MADILMLRMTKVNDFLIYLQAEKRYASHTIKAYRNDLIQFHAFCEDCDQEGVELHYRTIRSWVVHLMDSNYSTRSVHRKLTALRTYCKYLIRLGTLEANPLDRVLKPKLSKRVPAFIEERKMEQLLDDFDFGDDFTGMRNRLVLDLLYQTGMRRSELIGLSIRSLDLPGRSLKVMGKRGKERIIPLNDGLVRSLENYLDIRKSVIMDLNEGKAVRYRQGYTSL